MQDIKETKPMIVKMQIVLKDKHLRYLLGVLFQIDQWNGCYYKLQSDWHILYALNEEHQSQNANYQSLLSSYRQS